MTGLAGENLIGAEGAGGPAAQPYFDPSQQLFTDVNTQQ